MGGTMKPISKPIDPKELEEFKTLSNQLAQKIEKKKTYPITQEEETSAFEEPSTKPWRNLGRIVGDYDKLPAAPKSTEVGSEYEWYQWAKYLEKQTMQWQSEMKEEGGEEEKDLQNLEQMKKEVVRVLPPPADITADISWKIIQKKPNLTKE